MITLALACVGLAAAVEVPAFGVRLDLPTRAESAGASSTSLLWRDSADGTTWSVERRGDGSGAALPVSLSAAAQMIANAMGASRVEPAVPARFGGVDAVRVRFDASGRAACAWVFLHDGYLYAVTVLASPAALDARADHVARTSTLAPAQVHARAPLTLAELGIALPGAADLPIGTIAGPIPAVALLDAPARAGLILARLPRATAAYAGKDAEGIAAALSSEGCAGAVPRRVRFAGHDAWSADCSRTGEGAAANPERVLVVENGDDTWLVRAITDAAHAGALDAWAARRLDGARLLR
ncbi:MAG: hypothetical protein RLZZ299_2348 [Pseudomonadota bacterium]|jgi:hypothetical protein